MTLVECYYCILKVGFSIFTALTFVSCFHVYNLCTEMFFCLLKMGLTLSPTVVKINYRFNILISRQNCKEMFALTFVSLHGLGKTGWATKAKRCNYSFHFYEFVITHSRLFIWKGKLKSLMALNIVSWFSWRNLFVLKSSGTKPQ